jgi:hypothetical protein
MPAFLAALAVRGNIAEAAADVPIDRSMPYWAAKKYPDFAVAIAVAKQVYADCLEREADRRALQGVDRVRTTARGEPILDPRDPEGKTVLIDKQYSDNLLALRLRALKPAEYHRPNEPAAAPTVAVGVLDLRLPGALEFVKALRDKIVPSKPPAKPPPPQLPNGEGCGPGAGQHLDGDPPEEQLP